MIQLKTFTFNALQENTYVLYDDTREAIIIDPGCYGRAEEATLKAFVAAEGLRVTHLLNTHCHIDHVLGNHFVKSTYGVDLWIHPADEPVLRAVETYAPQWGFAQYAPTTAEHFFEGDTFSFGQSTLEIRFTPGHAPGHVVFYAAEDGFCVGGDVLFRESIGRTDLPGGHHQTLLRSIREQLFTLPDDTVVHPGHGPTTTIAHEKRYNPFLD